MKLNKVKNSKTSGTNSRIYIRLESTSNSDQLMLLKKHIDKFKGNCEVVLVVGSQEEKQVIRVPEKTDNSETSINELIQLFGPENVKLS